MSSPFLIQARSSGMTVDPDDARLGKNKEPRCRTCVYFHPRSTTGIYGDCRRHPPSNMQGERFPQVERTEYCGEWNSGHKEEKEHA